MLKINVGAKLFYVVAESVHMGMNFIDIKITDNEVWAKSKTNVIIGKINANTIDEARELFKIRDMTR